MTRVSKLGLKEDWRKEGGGEAIKNAENVWAANGAGIKCATLPHSLPWEREAGRGGLRYSSICLARLYQSSEEVQTPRDLVLVLQGA